jgi:hypothetical protein
VFLIKFRVKSFKNFYVEPLWKGKFQKNGVGWVNKFCDFWLGRLVSGPLPAEC